MVKTSAAERNCWEAVPGSDSGACQLIQLDSFVGCNQRRAPSRYPPSLRAYRRDSSLSSSPPVVGVEQLDVGKQSVGWNKGGARGPTRSHPRPRTTTASRLTTAIGTQKKSMGSSKRKQRSGKGHAQREFSRLDWTNSQLTWGPSSHQPCARETPDPKERCTFFTLFFNISKSDSFITVISPSSVNDKRGVSFCHRSSLIQHTTPNFSRSNSGRWACMPHPLSVMATVFFVRCPINYTEPHHTINS